MKAYERFLSYVKINTTSNDKSTDCPSTPRQKELALSLVKEMQDIGIADAQMDAHGYVYGTLDANCDEDAPTIGLIAHMDRILLYHKEAAEMLHRTGNPMGGM